MDTEKAFAMGKANKGKELMVFDWSKAAKLIAEQKPNTASAGLHDDWEYTGGKIYKNGKPVKKEDTYTYLSSTWAEPELDMDGVIFPCFIMKSEKPEWDSDSYWPKEALEIINKNKN